jgi:hypothetical protein
MAGFEERTPKIGSLNDAESTDELSNIDADAESIMESEIDAI